MSDHYILVSGARERNLKNINVLIPKKKLRFLQVFPVQENHLWYLIQ